MKNLAYVGAIASLLLACGKDDVPPAKAPEPSPAASRSAAPSAVATPAVSAISSAAPSSSTPPPPPPAPKGTVHAFTRAATSGKADKVGQRDGNFKADGIKDNVFEVDYEGAASAFFLVSTDMSGAPTGEYDADTLVGDQAFPGELAGVMNAGKLTDGLVVFEGDKLLNGKDGAVSLPEGRRKLFLHISTKTPPQTMRLFVLHPDKSLIKGPVFSK